MEIQNLIFVCWRSLFIINNKRRPSTQKGLLDEFKSSSERSRTTFKHDRELMLEKNTFSKWPQIWLTEVFDDGESDFDFCLKTMLIVHQRQKSFFNTKRARSRVEGLLWTFNNDFWTRWRINCDEKYLLQMSSNLVGIGFLTWRIRFWF